MANKPEKTLFKTLKLKIAGLAFADLAWLSIGVAILITFAYLFFRKPSTLTVTIKVGEDNIVYNSWNYYYRGTRSWFSQMFYLGMKEKNGLGGTSAEVLKVRSYDTWPAQKAVYLTLRLDTVYNRASNQYTYRGKPVLIGSTLKLYLDNLLVEGIVTYVQGAKDPRQRVVLRVENQVREETPVYPETSGARPYIADSLNVGDEIKDDQGNTIIKIIDKKVENARRIVTTSDGRILIQSNPLRKDIFLTLEIQAVKINNQYFVFDDVPLLVGTGLQLNFPTISVGSEVTKFLSAQ